MHRFGRLILELIFWWGTAEPTTGPFLYQGSHWSGLWQEAVGAQKPFTGAFSGGLFTEGQQGCGSQWQLSLPGTQQERGLRVLPSGRSSGWSRGRRLTQVLPPDRTARRDRGDATAAPPPPPRTSCPRLWVHLALRGQCTSAVSFPGIVHTEADNASAGMRTTSTSRGPQAQDLSLGVLRIQALKQSL